MDIDWMVNFDSNGITETDTHMMVPTIATREGVQNESLKLAEVLKEAAPFFNGIPFVANGHPMDDHGHFIEVTKEMASGELKDFKFREKTRDVAGVTVLDKNDKRNAKIMVDLRKGEIIEDSIGFDTTKIPAEGEFDGKKFTNIETQIRPDHLARVDLGACTIEDGCGIGRVNCANQSLQVNQENSNPCIFITKLDTNNHECGGECEGHDNENENKGILKMIHETVMQILNDRGILKNGKKANTVVRSHDPSKAPIEQAWDFRAAEYDVNQLKFAASWFDEENPDTKSSYKLPHHESNGQTVWRGVATAMNALLGGRGGVTIPIGDRRGVYNHLASHYRQFDRDPPEFRVVVTKKNKETEATRLEESEAEQFGTQIEDLTKENKDLLGEKETLSAELEKQKTEFEEFQKSHEDYEDLKTKVEASEKENNEKIEKEKNEVIKKITELNGEKPEKYADWELGHLKELETNTQAGVDRTLKVQNTENDDQPSPSIGNWVPNGGPNGTGMFSGEIAELKAKGEL